MKALLLTAAILAAAPAYAGGPVIIEETDDFVASNSDDRPNILPILIGIGILAIIASGGGGSDVCNGAESPVDAVDQGPGC
jgi:hypothetical protein